MAIERLGIVGSGIMGSGIAEVAAKAGVTVVLRSRKQESADAMVAGLGKSLAKQVGRGKLDEAEAEAIRGRVSATADLDALADCDLVLESVVEDLDVKKQLFAELDRIVKDGAILATNTSTLPVVEMAVETGRPERVVRHPLLQPGAGDEPGRGRPHAGVERRDRGRGRRLRRGLRQGVRSWSRTGPGFIVNALLFPYLNNAVRMLENRTASRDDIDAAMKGGCNFPMGPLALLDLVGLDTSVAILDALYAEFRDPNYAAVPLLRRMVVAGHLGRKSGQGFYDYAKK